MYMHACVNVALSVRILFACMYEYGCMHTDVFIRASECTDIVCIYIYTNIHIDICVQACQCVCVCANVRKVHNWRHLDLKGPRWWTDE